MWEDFFLIVGYNVYINKVGKNPHWYNVKVSDTTMTSKASQPVQIEF